MQGSNNAKVLCQNQTNAEKVLWHQLRDRRLTNYKFRRQVTMADSQDRESWIVTAFVYDAEGASTPAEMRRNVARTGSAHARSPRSKS